MSRPTRKAIAATLLDRLKSGPSIAMPGRQRLITEAEAERQCKIWLDSWITPAVRKLVPELKPRKTQTTTEATP